MFVRHPGCTNIRRAKVRDLGVGGACLVTGEPPAVGSVVSVGFFLRDDPDPLVATARVVWTMHGSEGHVTGLVFDHGETGQRLAMLRLSVYLEARLAAATG